MFEESIIRMSKLEKLGRINEITKELDMLNKHLADIPFKHKGNLSYQQNLILYAMVDKYNKNGKPVALTTREVARIIYDDADGYKLVIGKDMKFLTNCGYLKANKYSPQTMAYCLNLEKFV